MTRDDIIKAWNTQADKHNRWSDLGEDEMLEFAMRLEREACARLCDNLDDDIPDGLAGWQFAEAIRAREEKRPKKKPCASYAYCLRWKL